ncbi:MAG: efflux RND transporter periplasmic adaptor subunit [Polyangiaceae bacterium]
MSNERGAEAMGVDATGRSEAPRPKSARVGIIIAVSLGLVFAGMMGVRVKQSLARKTEQEQSRAAAQASGKKREPLRTVSPAPARWAPRVDLTGTLKPWRDADLGFETQGRLVRIGVGVGDDVKAGQVLAVLDASRAAAQVGQAESQVRGAEASLALAEDNLRRTEALAAKKSIAEAQVEQARQQVAMAKAQLDGAHASTRLARTGAGLHSVVAPFSGVVTRAPTGIGGVVNPGVALFHLEDASHYRLSATIGEEDVPLVTVGAPVHVVYREHVVEGKVTALVRSLDQATRRAPVEIEVPASPGLLTWGFVRARISGGGEVDVVRIPPEARRPGAQDEVVKVVRGADGARAHIVKVSFAVDEKDGTLVVQRGLTAADEVLLSPSVELADGELVDVAPAK